ncbi:DUF5333 domain-containing protein [Acidimangrovimonas pyrenivorans]|uniref:DUF5333 domain-containing protein n=1 Tax=Acidimangrovimonas pyrenivorans TaxID=2030798 RepID=A0ABV7AKH0_9RHOB
MKTFALAAALSLAAFATQAAALPPLTSDNHVMGQLVAARVADRIRHACPTISGRLVTAFFKAEALKSYALNKGYSGDEIKAFLKDPAAKKLVKDGAEHYLAKNGAKDGQPRSFCKLGEAEIASNSLIGSLLRAH